jgi:hypothetical protein
MTNYEVFPMIRILAVACLFSLIMACNPTVRIETPSEPIRIEANITIKHEIVIKVQKDVEEVLNDEDLF